MKSSFLVAISVAALLLAGCGGGGGVATSSGSGGGVVPTSPSNPTGWSSVGGPTVDDESRTDAGAAFAAASTSFSFGSVLQAIAEDAPVPAPAAAPPACNTQGTYPTERVMTANSSSVKTFFDSACTVLRSDNEQTFNYPATGTGSGTGTIVWYYNTGAMVDYITTNSVETSLNGKIQQFAEYRSQSLTAGGAAYASYGWSCDFSGYPAVACSRSNDTQISAENFNAGYAATINGTITPPASPSAPCPQYTTAFTFTGSEFVGPLGSISIPSISNGNVPTWDVTGGSQVATSSGTYGNTWDCNSVSHNQNVTINDSASGLTTNIVFEPSLPTEPRMIGTVYTTGKGDASTPVATIRVTTEGNGKITYADGTVDWVIDWTITNEPAGPGSGIISTT